MNNYFAKVNIKKVLIRRKNENSGRNLKGFLFLINNRVETKTKLINNASIGSEAISNRMPTTVTW